MEIKDTATYPYPIWGLNDDFLGPEPDGTYNLSLDPISNEFVFDYELTTINEGVARLIEEDKARYKCIVECNKTYFLAMKESKEPRFEFRFPTDKVFKNYSVKVLVVAIKNIEACDYLELSDVWEGVADYPKGSVIANIDKIEYNTKQKDNVSDLSQIFRSLPTDVDEVEYSVDGSRIVIKYPQNSKVYFESVESNLASVIESSFVFPALVYALGRLHEFIPVIDNYDWAYYLKNIVDDYVEVKNTTIDPEYNLDIQQVFDIANYVFRNLHTDMLEEAKRVIDQALGD